MACSGLRNEMNSFIHTCVVLLPTCMERFCISKEPPNRSSCASWPARVIYVTLQDKWSVLLQIAGLLLTRDRCMHVHVLTRHYPLPPPPPPPLPLLTLLPLLLPLLPLPCPYISPPAWLCTTYGSSTTRPRRPESTVKLNQNGNDRIPNDKEFLSPACKPLHLTRSSGRRT